MSDIQELKHQYLALMKANAELIAKLDAPLDQLLTEISDTCTKSSRVYKVMRQDTNAILEGVARKHGLSIKSADFTYFKNKVESLSKSCTVKELYHKYLNEDELYWPDGTAAEDDLYFTTCVMVAEATSLVRLSAEQCDKFSEQIVAIRKECEEHISNTVEFVDNLKDEIEIDGTTAFILDSISMAEDVIMDYDHQDDYGDYFTDSARVYYSFAENLLHAKSVFTVCNDLLPTLEIVEKLFN